VTGFADQNVIDCGHGGAVKSLFSLEISIALTKEEVTSDSLLWIAVWISMNCEVQYLEERCW
jgi:hypothetical protein